MEMEGFVHEEEEADDHPMRYLPIRRLYTSTAPCGNPIGSMSKKVKARKRVTGDEAVVELEKEKPSDLDRKHDTTKPLLVYHRRAKKARASSSFFDSIAPQIECKLDSESSKQDEPGIGPNCVVVTEEQERRKKKRMLNRELVSLGGSATSGFGGSRRLRGGSDGSKEKDQHETPRKSVPRAHKDSSASGKEKKWVQVEIKGVDPHTFIGLTCKVFWPMDDDWYRGSVTGYNSLTDQHTVEYDDGDTENLCFPKEKLKFNISCEEMQNLDVKCVAPGTNKTGLDYDEMLSLAVSYDDCQDLESGDLVWAKLTGHAMWPAVVVDESNIGASRSLKPLRRDTSILVQFFGTHDFARINLKQAIPFLNGLLSSLHLKCKKPHFYRSLDEAKLYLSKHQLPKSMLRVQKNMRADDYEDAFREDVERPESCHTLLGDERIQEVVKCSKTSPIGLGNLRVTNLGKIVCDSEHFHNQHDIWPEGYTAFRRFTSIKDPCARTSYKMEVLRNPKFKTRPLFRVTSADGEQIIGPNPRACWKEIYSRIGKNISNGFRADVEGCDFQKSGSYMFGFSYPEISKFIEDLPNSKLCLKYFESCWELPSGYKAVRVDWKDLDRCSVCHMDEEYEDNLFLQCDKCRMMVHARCYGELEPLDGMLWLCNLCRPGATRSPPPCCLCPVIGGAIKPTTDGRWAHLTCAIWIPETCLLDVKKMEPIDGVNRINKHRWKLLCSICGISYGACIQCADSTCRVAYHPLCARAAGFCTELEDEGNIHLMSLDEDDDQCIRLLSFCKKHRQPSDVRQPADESLKLPVHHGSSYIPTSNSSGCARCEPYNLFGRRGQREPQILAAASAKRLYLENRPYLVSGYCQKGLGSSTNDGYLQTICVSGALKSGKPPGSIFSMTEKYNNMKETYKKRLAFGKSRIHGFGVFAKVAHKAGDMVIEYVGELVRPPIADMREHRIYNSLVGAGTYMFRIDDDRVIDATRAGSIAHLINHSCEPNCYSRGIRVNRDEHIIIFAKRDINKWEELTYDYRFFSIDEQLACYCGFPRCRGVVNDIDAEEKFTKILVPKGDLIH